MLTTTRLNLALFLARLPLGAYFAIAGFNKIVGGVGGFVAKQIENPPSGVPVEFLRSYLWALPFVELAAGIFVILGLLVRVNALLMSLMLVSFLVAAQKPAYIAKVYGTSGTPFDSNWILLGLALCLTLLGAGEWGSHRAFRRRRRVLVETSDPVVTTRGTKIV